MRLKEDSIYGNLWKWFYVADSLPKSLCAYFWTFIAAFVFSPIVFVLRLPEMIWWAIQEKRYDRKVAESNGNKSVYKSDYFRDKWDDGFWYRAKVAFVFWIVGFIIYIYVKGVIHIFHGWYGTTYSKVSLGATIIGVALFILFVILYAFEKKKIKIKIKKPVFIEMANEYRKGFMEKYCPRIDWY
jgi:hypothetical protein